MTLRCLVLFLDIGTFPSSSIPADLLAMHFDFVLFSFGIPRNRETELSIFCSLNPMLQISPKGLRIELPFNSPTIGIARNLRRGFYRGNRLLLWGKEKFPAIAVKEWPGICWHLYRLECDKLIPMLSSNCWFGCTATMLHGESMIQKSRFFPIVKCRIMLHCTKYESAQPLRRCS